MYLYLLLLFTNIVIVTKQNEISCDRNIWGSPTRDGAYTYYSGSHVTILCTRCLPNQVSFGSDLRWQILYKNLHYYDEKMFHIVYRPWDKSFFMTIKNLDITDTGNYIIKCADGRTIHIRINVILHNIPPTDYVNVQLIEHKTTSLRCPDIMMKNKDISNDHIYDSYKYYWEHINFETGNQSLFIDEYQQTLHLTSKNLKGVGWYACTVFDSMVFYIPGSGNLNNYVSYPYLPFIALFKVDKICTNKRYSKKYDNITYHGLTPVKFRGKISQADISRPDNRIVYKIVCSSLDLVLSIALWWIPLDWNSICEYIAVKHNL